MLSKIYKVIALIILVILGAFALMLILLRYSHQRQLSTLDSHNRAYLQRNAPLVDSLLQQLHEGDILLRRGSGPDSYMLSQMNKTDKTYSHCGLVHFINNKPFVYHCIGGEDNPDQRMRLEPAAQFCTPMFNKGIGLARMALQPTQLTQLMTISAGIYANKPLFDLSFDLKTDQALYCSEFVYKAVLQATGDAQFIPLTQGMGRNYVGIDDLYLNTHTALIWKATFK